MTGRIRIWWTRVRRRAIQILTPGRSRKVKGRQFDGTPAMGGKLLTFYPISNVLGHVKYSVVSKRGGMEMGEIQWSNQWGRARFKPHPEAIFDQQCVAEIYACMRDLK